MNDSRSSAQISRCYEQLKVMAYMNDSELWAQAFRCYEYLRDEDDMNYS